MVGGSAAGLIRRQRANRSTPGRSIMRKIALSLAIIGLGLPLLAASPAQAQAARTWVSGLGDDANMASNCSRSMPCKTFGAAISKTTVGGEINCLDPGGFGQVGITFTITISCEAATGGILAPNNATGVLIDDNDTGTAVVTLRGLDIDGQGSGQFGLWINSAKAVHIENSTIRNFRGAFARSIVTAGISTIYLYVADTVISDNSIGISLETLGGYKVASLKNVVITG